VKYKVAPPFTECEFDITHDEGISRAGSLIDLGLEYNILEKKGSWIAFAGKMVGQGRESAKQTLRNDAELSQTIGKAIVAKVNVSGGTVLAESVKELETTSVE
jgi:recombination protein RecA